GRPAKTPARFKRQGLSTPRPEPSSLQRPSPRLARRLQRRATRRLQFRIRRRADRSRPAGSRGHARRQKTLVGRESHEISQCSRSRPFTQREISPRLGTPRIMIPHGQPQTPPGTERGIYSASTSANHSLSNNTSTKDSKRNGSGTTRPRVVELVALR